MLTCSLIIAQCHYYHAFLKFLKDSYLIDVLTIFDTNGILNDKQFGFRLKHSTYMTIAQLVDKINTAVEKKKPQLESFWIYQKHLIQLITIFFCIN